MYGNDFTIAPLSVLIDPARAIRVFGLQPGPSFSPKVIYIFKKQLEEADIIVISKSDTLAAGQIEELTTAIAREFPRAQILSASARNGMDLDGWFHHLESDEQIERQVMDVDYEIYAEGEALLGWLNATLQISSTEYFDANSVLTTLAKNVQGRLCRSGSEIAHFKMTFSPDSGLGDIAVINLVRNDFVPELSITLEHPVNSGQVIINLRAEEDPERLASTLRESVAELHGQVPGLQANLEHLEKFRPGKPTPTHRVGNL
jgi:G3E family GTPase